MKKFIGLVLLLAVVGAAALLTLKKPGSEPIVLKGSIGGEKSALINDPEFQKLLKERYQIVLETEKRGSLEMVTESDNTGKDFLWPSSSVALALYRDAGKPLVASENVLNSPLVLYTWAKVADRLTAQKQDFPKLVDAAGGRQDLERAGPKRALRTRRALHHRPGEVVVREPLRGAPAHRPRRGQHR